HRAAHALVAQHVDGVFGVDSGNGDVLGRVDDRPLRGLTGETHEAEPGSSRCSHALLSLFLGPRRLWSLELDRNEPIEIRVLRCVDNVPRAQFKRAGVQEYALAVSDVEVLLHGASYAVIHCVISNRIRPRFSIGSPPPCWSAGSKSH